MNRMNGEPCHPPTTPTNKANKEIKQMNDTKVCSVCGDEFAATTEYFYVDTRYSPPRLRAACKKCMNKRDSAKRDPEKVIQKAKRYRERHPDRVKQANRDWRARNLESQRQMEREAKRRVDPEKRRTYDRAWRAQNPDKVFQYQRKFYPTVRRKGQDPEKLKAKTHRYLAKKRGLPRTYTGKDWAAALLYFNYRCAVCGRPLYGEHHTATPDHWIPINAPNCPGTIPMNIVPLCHGKNGCNNSKGDNEAEQWLIKRFGYERGQHILHRIQEYFAHIHSMKSVE
jgi:hypothetical protein